MGNVLAKVPDARSISSPLYSCRGVMQTTGSHMVGTHQLSRAMTPSNDSGVAYRMNGTHADIPSSSSIPVTPVPRTPKHNSQRSMSTVHHLDPEQGSLGSQGSVDLPVDCGQARLLELGYKQELTRRLGPMTSFSLSLSAMCFFSFFGGLPTAYVYGGPVAAVWGWVAASLANILVGLSMAEIASSYPVAGGPYFWCLELTRNNKKYTLIAWITGWLNVLGQFATTGTLGYITVKHLGVMWMLANGHVFSNAETFLAYAICLLLAGLVSSVPAKRIQQFAVFSAITLVFGGIIIMILLPLCAPKLQPATWVFSSFFAWEKEEQGIPTDAWLFLLGMLASQLVFIGFESPSQFAEETRKADRTVPKAILWSIIACGILGGALVLVLLFCIQDRDNLLTGEAQGYAAAQIFYDVFKGRFGNGAGGIVLLAIPLLSFFNATVISMGTNARMLWSFSRDRGVPLYKVWVVVSKRTATPLNATWAMTALAFFLGLPILFSPSTFLAMGSISFAGLYISYTVPIALRMVMGKSFPLGPFKLGMPQPVINVGAIIYMIVSVIVMLLPTQLPVDSNNMNYTCVTVGAVMILVMGAWYLPYWGAKNWYIPKRHLQPADLPKPPARTLRAKHGGASNGASPSGSRAASVKTVPSTGSLPRVPSLDSQASPPYPSARHPLHRSTSDDGSEMSVYQPRLQLPDIWKQPTPRRPQRREEPERLPVLREAPGKGPMVPPHD